MNSAPQQAPRIIRHTLPRWRALPQVEHGFFGSAGGVSAGPFSSLNVGAAVGDVPANVLENRARVARALGAEPSSWVVASQVHGARVVQVDGPLPVPPEADALVTAREDCTLFVYTADCVPVLLSCARGVAVAHAGWKGTVAHVARAALEALCALGDCPAAEVEVAIGPAIGGCCYEVDGPRARALALVADGVGVRFDGADRARVDLVAIVCAQLQAAGVRPPRLSVHGACTACQPGWFSHRASGGRCGRQASGVRWKGER